MKMKTRNRKGFTLIELLIVIAIIAVLSVVVILSLNPAELLRQARDANRVSDMSTLKSAIALYLADQVSPSLGNPGTCYLSATTTFATVATSNGAWTYPSINGCQNWMSTAGGTASTTATTTRGVTSATSGWIPVNFSAISSGSPIGQQPIDAVNQGGTCSGPSSSVSLSNCQLQYSYIVGSGGTTFKLAAFMESQKYAYITSASNVTVSDGGINPYVFEGGTNPAL